MRYVRIFLLYFEQVLEHRSRVLVWFLIGLVNSLLYFIFWHGVTGDASVASEPISLSSITTYYFLLIIAGAFLLVHIEEDVAYWDIQQGGLTRYLAKPFSYFLSKFLDEIAYRIGQGVLGIIAFVAFTQLFGQYVQLEHRPVFVVLAIISVIMAYLISFIFKMIIGISTFWITDYSGLHQLTTVLLLIFAGFVIPLEFLPNFLQTAANALPFAYMIYYPVRMVQGALDISLLGRVIGMQGFWFIFLLLIYRMLWKRGVREYTGIGQ